MPLYGMNLSQVRRERLLSLQEWLPIFKDMILSLETLHTAGWVHNDVKPDNFLLRETISARKLASQIKRAK